MARVFEKIILFKKVEDHETNNYFRTNGEYYESISFISVMLVEQ